MHTVITDHNTGQVVLELEPQNGIITRLRLSPAQTKTLAAQLIGAAIVIQTELHPTGTLTDRLHNAYRELAG